MNLNDIQLFCNVFRGFQWTNNINSIRELAAHLSETIIFCQTENNPDLNYLLKLLKHCVTQHKCNQNLEITKKLIENEYNYNKPFQNWTKVNNFEFETIFQDLNSVKNIQQTRNLHYINIFERKYIIPHEYQQLSVSDNFEENEPEVESKKTKIDLTKIDKLINEKTTIINGLIHFKRYWPDSCKFLIKSLLNECLVTKNLNEQHVDLIEEIIFQDDDNVDLMENMSFFLERILLKIAKNILIENVNENADVIRKLAIVKKNAINSEVVHQKFITIFNDILIESNFEPKLMNWFLNFSSEIQN